MVPGLAVFYCIVLVNARSTHDAHGPLSSAEQASENGRNIANYITDFHKLYNHLWRTRRDICGNVTKRTKCNERKKAATCQLKFNISF